MNFLKSILALTMLAGSISVLHAVDEEDLRDFSEYQEDVEEKDWRALRDFIRSKRTVDLLEKARNLTISGEVGFDCRHTNETLNGVRRRGGDAVNSKGYLIPRNDFDVEFTLNVDYLQDDYAWLVAQVKFDNSAGYYDTIPRDYVWEMMGSGSQSDIKLKKAFFGYNLYTNDNSCIDIELGRRQFYQVFDSRIQFASRFDGVLIRHETDTKCYGKYFNNLGAFVVDQRAKHYGYVWETGIVGVLDSGFDVKASYIHWKKHGRNAVRQDPFKGSDFENIQLTVNYHLDPSYCYELPLDLFSGFLVNVDALENELYTVNSEGEIVYRRENIGWYTGFILGRVRAKGDWAIGLQYQWVEAQAVPDQDMSGIGRGNVDRNFLYTNGIGNCNFKGWRLDMLYALTDNLSIDLRFDSSQPILRNYNALVPISPDDPQVIVPVNFSDFDYSQLKVEAIYAF